MPKESMDDPAMDDLTHLSQPFNLSSEPLTKTRKQ